MPPETIPKPRSPSTRIINIDGNRVSLATQMGLDGSKSNRRVYFDIVHSTGVLCQEYFPLKESMSGGWKITPILRILAPKLLKKFPILYNYAGQRPIAIMISRHYAMCQCGAKNGLVRSAPGQSSPVEKIVVPNTNARSIRAVRGKSTGGLPCNLCFQDSASYKRSGNNGRDDRVRKATPSSSSSPTLASGASVAQFLSTLAQDLSDLSPIFIDHGVGDDISLRSILRMNNWRAWMYAWVKEGVLTELQFQMIVDGLKKLV